MNQKTKIQFQTFDYVVIALVAILLVTTWFYTVIYYAELPETIAVHFDGNGQPNGYNSKSAIWIAPFLFSALSIGLIFGAKNPEGINIPYKNLSVLEKKVNSRTLLFASLLLSSLLFLIILSMIKTSLNSQFNTQWIAPSVIALIVLFFAAFLYSKFKYTKS